MLSANSLRAESSKIRRGLVADSVRTARGRLRYSVALWVFMGSLSLSGFLRRGDGGVDALFCPLQGQGRASGAWALLLPREGFEEALQAEVFVPQLGKAFVLAVEFAVHDVVPVVDQ